MGAFINALMGGQDLRRREWADLVADRMTPFMVGQLVGANILAHHMLRDSPDPAAQRASEVLGDITSFFLADVEDGVRRVVPVSEANTELVRP